VLRRIVEFMEFPAGQQERGGCQAEHADAREDQGSV